MAVGMVKKHAGIIHFSQGVMPTQLPIISNFLYPMKVLLVNKKRNKSNAINVHCAKHRLAAMKQIGEVYMNRDAPTTKKK